MFARFRSVVPALLAVSLFSAALCRPLEATDNTLTLDTSHTQVAWTLAASLHTVHGTFKLRSGTIQFDPNTGKASGLIVVDATSGESGNGSRDHKMHKEVLQSEQYPEISFTPTAIHGAVVSEGTSQVRVDGIFSVHGAQHPLTLDAQLKASGGELTITTQFVVPYAQWGMKNPSTLFLRVGGSVQIDIQAQGRLTAAAE